MASFITSTNPFITETFDLGNTLARASQVNALHAIQVRSEEVIEQVHLIDTVRARPFIDETTH